MEVIYTISCTLKTIKLQLLSKPKLGFPQSTQLFNCHVYKRKGLTINNFIGNKCLFRGYLNVECYFLHDVNSFRKCFSHLLHTVKILHWLLNITVLFQQLKLPWKQMINRRAIRYLYWIAVSVATANALPMLFNLVSFLELTTVRQWKNRLQKFLQTWKRKELPSLAKPELEECEGADVKFNRTYRQALWKWAESTNTFLGWNYTETSVHWEPFQHITTFQDLNAHTQLWLQEGGGITREKDRYLRTESFDSKQDSKNPYRARKFRHTHKCFPSNLFWLQFLPLCQLSQVCW